MTPAPANLEFPYRPGRGFQAVLAAFFFVSLACLAGLAVFAALGHLTVAELLQPRRGGTLLFGILFAALADTFIAMIWIRSRGSVLRIDNGNLVIGSPDRCRVTRLREIRNLKLISAARPRGLVVETSTGGSAFISESMLPDASAFDQVYQVLKSAPA